VIILITGASGFLGRMFQQTFVKDHNVASLGRSNSNVIKCDLSKTIPDLHENTEIVVHAAGLAHTNPKSNKEKQVFFDTNVEGTLNLLQALEKTSLKKFVFISSVSVYGLDKGESIDELSPLDGASPYALSKIQAEAIVINWCNGRHIDFLILRLPLIVGPNSVGNLGIMINAVHNGTYLRIGKGNAKKSMVLATDVDSLISNWINDPIAPSGTYNLTDGYHPSFYEVEEAIKLNAGKNRIRTIPLSLAKLLGKLGDLFSFFPVNSSTIQKITTTCTFSDEKARNELKWNPSPVLSFWEE
jgi:nucleoside-diphosphate-sugar epimerase